MAGIFVVDHRFGKRRLTFFIPSRRVVFFQLARVHSIHAKNSRPVDTTHVTSVINKLVIKVAPNTYLSLSFSLLDARYIYYIINKI